MIITLSILCTGQCFGDTKFQKMDNTDNLGAFHHAAHKTLEQCRVGNLILTNITLILLNIFQLEAVKHD